MHLVTAVSIIIVALLMVPEYALHSTSTELCGIGIDSCEVRNLGSSVGVEMSHDQHADTPNSPQPPGAPAPGSPNYPGVRYNTGSGGWGSPGFVLPSIPPPPVYPHCPEAPGETVFCFEPDSLPGEEEPAEADVVVVPSVVRASDIAHFTPPPVGVTNEPNHIAVLNKPTNLLFQTPPMVVQHGTVLGHPVSVSFTHVATVVDHGDGTSYTYRNPSASWEWLNQRNFTETDTSHVYENTGVYTLTAQNVYSATVFFPGFGVSVPVDGVVTTSASRHWIQVFRQRVVLVDENCSENPGGVGCEPVRLMPPDWAN